MVWWERFIMGWCEILDGIAHILSLGVYSGTTLTFKWSFYTLMRKAK